MAPRSDPPEEKKLLGNIQLEDYGTAQYSKVEITEIKSVKRRINRNRLLQLFQFANATDKCLMIIGAICAVIQGSCFPVLSIVFGSMTNTFLTQYTMGTGTTSQGSNVTNNNSTSQSNPISEEFGRSMILYSNYYFLIAMIALVTAFLQTFCWELAAERQVYKLRKIFFLQLLRQDISWYDQNKDGDFSVKLSDDLERIREGLGIKFSLVVQYMSTFVSGILIGFYTNWRLTALITAVGPLMLGVSAYIAKVTANSSAREQLKYAYAGSVAEEVLSNVRTVAAFCKEKIEMKRYKIALEMGRKVAMQKYLIMSCGLAFVYFLMYTSYGFAFYIGAALVLRELCTPGSIFTVFFSVMAGAFSVGNALPFINSVSAAVGAAASIFDVIEREPDIDPYSESGLKPKSLDGCIELKNITFKYPARPDIQVLHDVSLKIEQGKVIAFVGSSGSGKSTLIGLILRFYDPTDGCIMLDGIPLQQLNVNWLRNQIGVVAQEPILFSVSIADNIRYGRSDVTQEEIEEAARIANAHHFIVRLPNGYQTLAGDRGSQISGGQKQRIAIARALVRNPKILLLDEATSALDAYSEGIVQEALEKAMCGRTTVIVAHRLSTIRNADMIYVIKNGHIRESGKHQELIIRKGLYYNLVLAQTLDTCIEEPSLEGDADFEPDYKRRISRSSSIASVDDTVNGIEYNEEDLPEVSIWQLVKYNAKEWFRLTMGIFACGVTGFVMPAFSIFYSQIFETFTLPEDQLMATAKFWAYILGVLAVVSSVAMFAQTLCLTSAAEKLILRMRSKAFSNILKQPIAWFDLPSSSTGYLVTRLARDGPLIKAAAGLRVGHVLTAVVTMGSGLIIALFFGWKLALILSVCVPFVAGASYQQSRILRRHQTQDARYMDHAGKIASECIQNIRTVQSLGNEKLFVRQYMESLLSPFKEAKKDSVYFGIVFSLSQTAIYLMYAAAFRVGYYLVLNGDMQPSDIYKVFFALSFCASSVGNTISYMQDYTKAKYAARRMMQLINRKSEIDPTVSWGLKPNISGNIEFSNVLFTYPSRIERNVLRGMSFKLAAGKSFALVGESGSGKSTVVAILERFYNPVRGSISIDGHDISLINLHHLRRNIGLVTQEPNLFDRSIKDNIAYGLDVNLNDAELMRRVIEVSRSVNLHNFVLKLPQGYDTMVGERGTQLSGGQKQRIAIARALIKNPKILLLDEATSALDTECEKIVQDALDRAREGRTCITIAHRLSTIQNADMIAVVNKGKIIEVGEHRELIASRGYYYKLIERQHI